MLYEIYKENKEGNDYCVGDLHGNYTALYALLDQIGFNKEKDRLFCLGDLTDRGLDSNKVLELLKNKWLFTIRGNHEDILIGHGLKSYEECYPENINKNGNQWFFSESLEHRQAIINRLNELPYAIQVGKIGLVHAYPLPDWKDTLKAIKNKNKIKIGNIIWSRTASKAVQKGEKIEAIKNIDVVLVGHHIFENPERHANVIFLDTGYFSGGSLTAVNLKTLKVAGRVFAKG